MRIYSITIFLNTLLNDSGKLCFPKLETNIRPTRGTAVIWKNTIKDKDIVNTLTLVEHEPTINDTKYVLNIWIRHSIFTVDIPKFITESLLPYNILSNIPFETLTNIACFILKAKTSNYQQKIIIINYIIESMLSVQYDSNAIKNLITSNKPMDMLQSDHIKLYRHLLNLFELYINRKNNISYGLNKIIIKYLV